MLWCVCFCNYADRQAIFSIFPLLRTELRLDELQLGIVASSFMWMYALAGPFAGWISDRISPRTVILGALAFWSTVTAGTAICHSFGSLVIFRTLGGLGRSLLLPCRHGSYRHIPQCSNALPCHGPASIECLRRDDCRAIDVGSHRRTTWLAYLVSDLRSGGSLLCLVLIFCLRTPAPQQRIKPPQQTRTSCAASRKFCRPCELSF